MFETENPKLRLVDTQPVTYEGEVYLLLRDPLELAQKNLLVPQPMIPLLALCDGSRDLAALRATLAIRYGLFISPTRVREFVEALDDALLLDNDRSRSAQAEARVQFRSAAFRPPASAGISYPDDPQELSALLQGYINQVDGHSTGRKTSPNKSHIRGIVSPHIDYERGGPVYAQVWGQAAEAVREADLAIVFGTDHFSEGRPISLTRQSYATPFGVLPTETKIVDELATLIGEAQAYAGELHHRREHSIELAAVWMHFIRQGNPIPMVPILTGSLALTGAEINGFNLESFLSTLHRSIEGRRVLVVAAGDLAHVGPAFDTDPVDPGKLILLKSADDELIQCMCGGDADGFYGAIHSVEDRNNVCGVSPIYLTLRLLAPSQGESQGYAVCPADTNQTSVVTICGITLQ